MILLGGELKASTDAAVGAETVRFLQKYNFTKGFFGVNGVHPRCGLSTPEASEAGGKGGGAFPVPGRICAGRPQQIRQISSVTFGALADAVLLTTVLAEKRYRSYTRIVEVDTL